MRLPGRSCCGSIWFRWRAHRCSTIAALALDNGQGSQYRIAVASIVLAFADAFGEPGFVGALGRSSVCHDWYAGAAFGKFLSLLQE